MEARGGGAPVTVHGRQLSLFILSGARTHRAVAGAVHAEVGAGGAATLVGRGAEATRLQQLIGISQQGASGQAVVVTGAAGHGKSALVRHVLAEVQRTGQGQGSLVLVAQSSAMLSESTPLQTAKQWLQRWRARVPSYFTYNALRHNDTLHILHETIRKPCIYIFRYVVVLYK